MPNSSFPGKGHFFFIYVFVLAAQLPWVPVSAHFNCGGSHCFATHFPIQAVRSSTLSNITVADTVCYMAHHPTNQTDRCQLTILCLPAIFFITKVVWFNSITAGCVKGLLIC
ncbi:hypothetical protein XENTR_v10013343 [Xenopus tropicalis]|nr:hypothetical protein XENTR_v10013343 [Xenopus tropicalis]